MLREIRPKEWNDNLFKAIGKDWLLVGAGDEKAYNVMTASWGEAGVLWGRDVMTVFIRPQRYTFGFMESGDYFSCQIFPDALHDIHKICGTKSGRDIDKARACNLTPVFDEKAPYFKEARAVVICRKLYHDIMREEAFVDRDVLEEDYPERDLHHIYIGKIEKIMIEEE
ncbi:MAG: flavin reductase [Clostridia bacterium]|nr:flavin reductase [Clostridia bacterium]